MENPSTSALGGGGGSRSTPSGPDVFPLLLDFVCRTCVPSSKSVYHACAPPPPPQHVWLLCLMHFIGTSGHSALEPPGRPHNTHAVPTKILCR